MSRSSLSLFVCVPLWLIAVGCDADLSSGVANSNQPKDLGAPWVNKTDSQFGFGATSSDAAMNRVFSCTTSDFGGLIESIANEYNAPIAVSPKAMLEWNLTVEVKGKNQEEVLKDVAAKCRLTLGKSSGGLPLLTFPGDSSGEESVVKPEVSEGGANVDE